MFDFIHRPRYWQYIITTLFVLSVLSLAGCATKSGPAVRGEKLLPTSIEVGDKVGVVIFDYMLCYERKSESCIPNEHVADAQRSFGSCVASNISTTASDVNVIYDNELQNALFTHREQLDYSEETLDAFVIQPEVTKILQARNLKYLVLLDVSTQEKDRRTTFDASEGVWGVGRESTRETVINARIYDVPNAQLTGHLSTRQVGARGYVVPVLLVIPLPPVPYSTMTEQNTCKSIGRSIGRYLINNEGISDEK